ncbi:MAG: hypothetical protein AAF529_16230 [Pseudomonadota bacterium]
MLREQSYLKPGVLAAVLLLLTGCVGSATGQLVPREYLDSGGSYYVVHQEKDGRDLHKDIAAAMRTRGMEVTSGTAADTPTDADYVITYVDRWQWDMRMYLADLRIEMRSGADNTIVGYGQSAQSSLKAMGKEHGDVIATALEQLLGPAQ